jgi:ribosomal protein S18 acetylase RimI-like enzyme
LGLEVRVAEASDVKAIMEIARKDTQLLGYTPQGGYLDFISKQQILVAIKDNKYCVGYLEFGGTTKDVWSIYNLAVIKIARNQGAGKALVNRLFELAREKQAGVRLKVTSTNSVAIAFYLRNGFIVVSKEATTNQSLYVMEKKASLL